MSENNGATATRRAVLLGGCFVICESSAWASPPTVPRILFVCQYGSVKSPIAREMLRLRARAREVVVSTFSRGITPEAHLPPAIAARLLAKGIDPAREGLHRLTPGDLQAADVTVLFNPLPGNMHAARSLDWTSVPSVLNAFPAALGEIERRVDLLLDLIAR